MENMIFRYMTPQYSGVIYLNIIFSICQFLQSWFKYLPHRHGSRCLAGNADCNFYQFSFIHTSSLTAAARQGTHDCYRSKDTQSMLHKLSKLHKYKPPFCERHRWGYETLSLLFAFQFYSPSDKISFIKPTHYRTRGGEWRGCIAATSHKYMSSVIR